MITICPLLLRAVTPDDPPLTVTSRTTQRIQKKKKTAKNVATNINSKQSEAFCFTVPVFFFLFSLDVARCVDFRPNSCQLVLAAALLFEASSSLSRGFQFISFPENLCCATLTALVYHPQHEISLRQTPHICCYCILSPLVHTSFVCTYASLTLLHFALGVFSVSRFDRSLYDKHPRSNPSICYC